MPIGAGRRGFHAGRSQQSRSGLQSHLRHSSGVGDWRERNYLLATAQVESGLDPQAGVTVAKIDGKRFLKAAFPALVAKSTLDRASKR